MKKVLAFISCVIGLTMSLLSPAGADSVLYTGVGSIDSNHGATLGFEFTPSVDLTVTALGVYDGGSDGPGLQVSHDVGLYSRTGPSTGALLVSTTVVDADPITHDFHFASITPVVLSAGQTYVLAAYYPSGMSGDKVLKSVLNPWPLVTLATASLGEGGSSLVFPTVQFPNPTFHMTANMQFTTTSQAGDGDLNFDGKVDAADVLLASRIVIGSLVPTANQQVAGDVAPRVGGQAQPDNLITLGDLLLITRAALGLVTL